MKEEIKATQQNATPTASALRVLWPLRAVDPLKCKIQGRDDQSPSATGCFPPPPPARCDGIMDFPPVSGKIIETKWNVLPHN